MLKYSMINENKVAILDNMLINNGNVTAFFILKPFNYYIMGSEYKRAHVETLYKVLSLLHHECPNLKFSMFKLINFMSKAKTIAEIERTIKIYDKNYVTMPQDYRKFISVLSKEFSILAININIKDTIDIEKDSILDIIKKKANSLINNVVLSNDYNIDKDFLISQSKKFYSVLRDYSVPATPKQVMNIYINRIYPTYNLSYNDYMVEHSEAILSNVQQEIIPKLGSFELTNSGIAILGLSPKKTYCSVITILEYPDEALTGNLNIDFPGLTVNIKLLEKEKAELKIKRVRASITSEKADAQVSGGNDNLEELSTSENITNYALSQIRKGRIACEVSANFLVTADSLEKLEEKKKKIIKDLNKINIIASIAPNQAQAYLKCIVNMNPGDLSYDHFMDLEYALSTQIDSGVLVGDEDSNFMSPVVGTTFLK